VPECPGSSQRASGELVAVKYARLDDEDSTADFERFKAELAMYEGPLLPLQGSVVPHLLAAGVFKVLI
jgi:hypothetical protein